MRAFFSSFLSQAALRVFLALPLFFGAELACSAEPPGSSQSAAAALDAYARADYADAIRLARIPADEGDPLAQYIAGSSIANAARSKAGLTQPTVEEASVWLRKSAAQGYVPAMRDLGHLYVLYMETSNMQEGGRWYVAAAEKGDADAQILLGLLKTNASDAFVIFSVAASTRDIERRTLATELANSARERLTSEQLVVAQQTIEHAKGTYGKALTDAEQLQSVKPRLSPRMTQEVAVHKHMASLPQLRFGSLVGRSLRLDPVFGALLYTGGGLIGRF